MTMPPDITVAELRSAIGRLLDAVEEQFGEELRFPVDYYWSIAPEEAFDIEGRPELLTMGQVSDDTASVRAFLNDAPDEHVVVQHESEHLRGVLQAIEHLDLYPYQAPDASDRTSTESSCTSRRRWWRRSRSWWH